MPAGTACASWMAQLGSGSSLDAATIASIERSQLEPDVGKSAITVRVYGSPRHHVGLECALARGESSQHWKPSATAETVAAAARTVFIVRGYLTKLPYRGVRN